MSRTRSNSMPCLALTVLAGAAWARPDVSHRPFSGAHGDGSDFAQWICCTHKPDGWFAGNEAIRIPDNLLSYQLPNGGWCKQIDMLSAPCQPGRQKSIYSSGEATSENEATTSQMRFLARAYNETHDPRYSETFLRGVDYILKGQYPAGW